MQTALALLFQGQRLFQIPNVLQPCRHLVGMKSIHGVDRIAQHDDDLGRGTKTLDSFWRGLGRQVVNRGLPNPGLIPGAGE